MQAKALLASGLIAVLVAGCSDRAAELGAQWDCGPIDGLGQIIKGRPPSFILVGEFTETNEAPAAFAELACHLAARHGEEGGPLFVGVSEYLGGATDAETKMRARLDALVATGAPIAIGIIGGDDHPYTVRQRSLAEREWARNIEVKVAAVGASRALLLMSRTDAIADTIPPSGDRFAGYDPMATFLPKGEVLALEILSTPQAGVSAPAIRLYPRMTDGFHGQIALASLTRPEVKLAKYEAHKKVDTGIDLSDPRIKAVIDAPMPREQKIDALKTILETYAARDSGPGGPVGSETLRRMAESLVRIRETTRETDMRNLSSSNFPDGVSVAPRRSSEDPAFATVPPLPIPAPQFDPPVFVPDDAPAQN